MNRIMNGKDVDQYEHQNELNMGCGEPALSDMRAE